MKSTFEVPRSFETIKNDIKDQIKTKLDTIEKVVCKNLRLQIETVLQVWEIREIAYGELVSKPKETLTEDEKKDKERLTTLKKSHGKPTLGQYKLTKEIENKIHKELEIIWTMQTYLLSLEYVIKTKIFPRRVSEFVSGTGKYISDYLQFSLKTLQKWGTVALPIEVWRIVDSARQYEQFLMAQKKNENLWRINLLRINLLHIKEPQVKIEDGIEPKVKIEDGIEPKVKMEDGIEPKVKMEDGIEPKVKMEDGIEPKVKMEDGIELKVKMEDGIELKVKMEDGIEPKVKIEDGIEPKIKMEDGIEPKVKIEDGIESRVKVETWAKAEAMEKAAAIKAQEEKTARAQEEKTARAQEETAARAQEETAKIKPSTIKHKAKKQDAVERMNAITGITDNQNSSDANKITRSGLGVFATNVHDKRQSNYLDDPNGELDDPNGENGLKKPKK